MGRGPVVDQRGQFFGQHALRLALFWAFSHLCCQIENRILRQKGEQLQKLHHVAVVCVDPVLVELVGRCFLCVQPNRARFGLAEFGPICLLQQGECQAVRLLVQPPAKQLDPGGDIAPLIAAADLEFTAVLGVQFCKVVRL